MLFKCNLEIKITDDDEGHRAMFASTDLAFVCPTSKRNQNKLTKYNDKLMLRIAFEKKNGK